MAKIKITKRTVEALKVATKDYIAFDTDLPGFGVRVMPSGRRFFLVQYRRHGRTRRVMIGQFEIVTAELTRREATIKLSSVRGADGDPAALRDAGRQSTTMKELGERFLNEYVPVRCKPSTQAEYRRSVELFLNPFFAKQRVRSVTTADVAELHGSLSHIPYQANRTLGVLSKMLNLAETWGMRDKHSNPCEDSNAIQSVSVSSSTHLTDLQHPWQHLREAAGLADVRIHDLRHTFASGGLLVGEGLAMIGKLLGHTQVQTTARYAHLASAPAKQAATKISDRLALVLLGPVDEPSAKKVKQSSLWIDNEADDAAAA